MFYWIILFIILVLIAYADDIIDIAICLIYNSRMNKLKKGKIRGKTLYLKQDEYLDCICRWKAVKEFKCIECFLRKYTVYAKLNNLSMNGVEDIYRYYLELKELYSDYPNDLELINQDIAIIERYLE